MQKIGNIVVVWDNVSSHTNDFICKEFENSGITLAYLPKYMTSMLQVVDIIINGPLKSDQRAQRAIKSL